MRWILGLVIAFTFVAPAAAKPVKVESIEVGDVGVIKLLSAAKTIEDDDISTGKRTEASKTKVIKKTTTIEARTGLVFGADFRIIGSPNGEKAKLTVIWRYPKPGLKNPQNGVVKFTDEYEDNFAIGGNCTVYWNLGEDWTIVPGTWTVELWREGQKLMSQSFTVVRAGTEVRDEMSRGNRN